MESWPSVGQSVPALVLTLDTIIINCHLVIGVFKPHVFVRMCVCTSKDRLFMPTWAKDKVKTVSQFLPAPHHYKHLVDPKLAM